MWMPDGTSTLEDSLAVSYKAKHSLTTCSSYHIPRYVTTELKTEVYPRNWTQIFIAVVEKKKSQKGKIPEMSFSRWVDEQTMVHQFNRIFHHKTKLATI